AEKPSLARVDGAPRFDVIEVHGPRPEALAAGMLTSIFLFASFTLLFQANTPSNAPAQLSEGSGSEVLPPDGSNDFAAQAVVIDPDARHKLIAAIALNLRQLYFDRAIGQQLADALLVHDKHVKCVSLGTGVD